jgi:hypothetical protein
VNAASRRGAAVAGGILVAVLIIMALWWTNRSGPAPAKVGDCVTAPAGGKFDKVDCSDAKARFQVIGSYDGHDSNQCDQTPKTVKALLATNGTKEWILCLGERK